MRTPLEWKRIFESDEFEKEYEYAGEDLGATLKEKETQFKVWAPTADAVNLNLYRCGDGGKSDDRKADSSSKAYASRIDDADSSKADNGMAEDKIGTIPMQKSDRGVWEISVGENLKNRYYTYDVTVEGKTQETQDVYARACGVNGLRSMVADLRDTDPEGWENDVYTYDSALLPAIYEVHIKDFSYAESSGIPKEYRGKYMAFTIEDSTLYGKGEKSTCISYLKELGITHVHLLPCFDFGSVDEAGNLDTQFNWGYDPVNYNVPEGSYATDARDGLTRIREFKEMVMALHKAGIGVIMDVVYNHTFALDSCFQRTVPYYYYRVREDGTLSNGSACGNDTASERIMFRRYMTESVCYWAKEYHIDGFRFDLMGLHDVETMNGIRHALDKLPNGQNILMYGEPWAAADTAMQKGAVPALKKNVGLLDERIAIFNDDTRDTIKGDIQDEKLPGFVNGGRKMEDRICSVIQAWCDGKGGYLPQGPGQTITYVSAHDNWTLWDKLCYTLQADPDFVKRDERVVQAYKFAAGIVMTSLGSVFMQAGEEAGRTKQGIGDSYNSPPDLNALDWDRMYRFEDLITYYKGMLAIRRSCSAYLLRNAAVLKAVKIHYSAQGCIAFSIDTQNMQDKWKRLWIVYSTREEPYRLSLPKAERILLADGKGVCLQPQEQHESDFVRIETAGVSVFGEVRK